MRSILIFSIALASLATASLRWKPCTTSNFPSLSNPEFSEILTPLKNISTIDCAELQVPLEYSAPNGENITLGMARYRSPTATKDPKAHLGSLIYNPGGPGGAGSTIVMAHALGIPSFTNTTVAHYDVIGLDPRGVGFSTRVKCDPVKFNKLPHVNIYPTTDEEFEELVSANTAFGESCRDMTGELFYHLDTSHAARDLEAVRIALGEEKLNWIGISYGSMLGAAYAEVYPENVGRMVLDGNLDHSQSETDAFATEIATYEATLDKFFEWCNETSTTVEECPFKNQDLPGIFDDLVAAADESPIPALDCIVGNQTICKTPVSGSDIRLNAQGKIKVKSEPKGTNYGDWTTFAQVLNNTVSGDASGLATRLATSEVDTWYPTFAIGCLEWRHDSKSVSDLKIKYSLAEYAAPHTKGSSTSYIWQVYCIGWPSELTNPPHWLNQTAMGKAPPILLVNSLFDPATGYVWGENMWEQMENSVLVSRRGSGHTSYPLLEGETVGVIDGFLVDGVVPGEGVVLDS